ncbi:unnamed protein product [Rotaria magnacalcarata]|uniref:Beta-lactamase-related domain-containing protein n=1 Tax=Rotaria magnacalcarata TaxID=392030 RepID=A0A816N768_9BILA|nr:unnamed protein product [Rotaria magnacalcarata]CAF2034642.1 unnamed protein product [Rotaria magnacalcarata]
MKDRCDYDCNAIRSLYVCAKGLVVTAVVLCVQRGLLDYSTPVRKYWFEYGQYGKENTTVADMVSTSCWIAIPFELVLNWTAIVHILEQRKPEWSPGTAYGYHG